MRCSPPRTCRAYLRCSAVWACCATRRARPCSGSKVALSRRSCDRIEERANYGDTASGRYLADEFAKEPFGWDFEAVRLLVLSLLRAGKIEATSKGQTIDAVTSVEARDTFSNNNLFRQASFRPKKGIEFEELVKASEAFRDTFGSEVRELNTGAIVPELRKEIARNEDTVASALATAHGTPPSWRHRAGRRPRPDEGDPARLGRQRDRYVQREPPRHQGRHQACRRA